MGESQSTVFKPKFNHSIEVESRPDRLTGDAGALILRDIYSRLGMDTFFDDRLHDPRRQDRITHPQVELLRTHLLLLAQGYADATDADFLRDDPVFRLSVSERSGDGPLRPVENGELTPTGLPSQPTLSRVVSVLGTQRQVLASGLCHLAGLRIRDANGGRRLDYATLDVDSVPFVVHGEQEGSAYNGHYKVRCYHPLVASLGEQGDFLDFRLREGNAHTAAGGLDFILPLLDKMEKEICDVASVRIDAGFPAEILLAALEDREVGYVARIRGNSRLEALAKPFIDRLCPEPQGEFENLAYHELSYRANSWSRDRRVVVVVKTTAGELFAEHFFLVTNWPVEQMPPEVILAFYRKRGSAEARFGELKTVLRPALSSTQRPKSHYRGEEPKVRAAQQDPFAANEVHLLLAGLAYNLLHVARTLLEKATGTGWGLGRLRQQILRTPARVLLHGRRVQIVLRRSVAPLWILLCRAVNLLRPPRTANA